MPSAAARKRLIAIITAKSLLKGKSIKLASGRTSNFYVNLKPTMLDPEGASIIANLMIAALKPLKADFVGGMELGAVPLIAYAVQASHAGRSRIKSGIPGFIVRKRVKEHGTRLPIEGLAGPGALAGKNVVILEDVTTTGGSLLQAAEAAREAGAVVAAAITVVDRLEGAEATLSAAGIKLVALLTAKDFPL
jgi:orotate phosphoribosyltransferase